MIVIDTTKPPQEPAKQKWDTRPDLLIEGDHDLCPGCGEPIALRCMLEVIEEMGLSKDAIGAVGIGCYTALTSLLDTDMVQCLHGRAPSVATGIKRMRPQSLVYTMQGDGDMVNEGLQEIIHSAARGENIRAWAAFDASNQPSRSNSAIPSGACMNRDASSARGSAKSLNAAWIAVSSIGRCYATPAARFKARPAAARRSPPPTATPAHSLAASIAPRRPPRPSAKHRSGAR